jgi:hypothetical protein
VETLDLKQVADYLKMHWQAQWGVFHRRFHQFG